MRYTIQTILIERVAFNPAQPRSNATTTALTGLAASMGDPADPILAQLPVVFPIAAGHFVVQAGERRVRAAIEQGVAQMQVLVLDETTPAIERHRLSLLENSHREELRVADEAIAFKIFHLYQNAVASGLEGEASRLMEEGQSPLAILQELQALLDARGWQRLKPQVTYEQCLAELGLDYNRGALMRRLRVLNLEIDVIERIQQLPILTEAAIRVLGKLTVEDQRLLLDAIIETPDIAKKVRRICRQVEQGKRTIHEAIAEARGRILLPPELEEEHETDEQPLPSIRGDQPAAPPPGATELEAPTMRFLDALAELEAALVVLGTTLGDTTITPEAAGEWYYPLQDGLQILSQMVIPWIDTG